MDLMSTEYIGLHIHNHPLPLSLGLLTHLVPYCLFIPDPHIALRLDPTLEVFERGEVVPHNLTVSIQGFPQMLSELQQLRSESPVGNQLGRMGSKEES